MSEPAKKLLDAVLALPAADRRWVVRELLSHPMDDDAEALWRAEALRRMEEIEGGRVKALEGEPEVASIERELHALRAR